METHQNVSGDEPAHARKDAPAVWFFVGAVFVILSPTFGKQLDVSINPVVTWIAGAILTAVGFWAMFRKP